MKAADEDVVVMEKIHESAGASVETITVPLDDRARKTGWRQSRVGVDGGAK